MTFPETPRVIYQRNPLVLVVCQLRFPPVLRIESELPARFQERIRGDYPLFRERRDPTIPVPPEVAKILGEDLLSMMGSIGNRHYEFSSTDDTWKASLTRDFVALATKKYEMWQAFRTRLSSVTDVLLEEYAPAFYTRIGLRYRDVIKKDEWGLEGTSWAELLKPHIAGELSSPGIASVIERVANDITIRLDVGYVRLKHGFGKKGEIIEPNVYIIDADFFVEEKTEVADALGRLDYFNREAGRLFRWAIQDRLHSAMAPRTV